MEKIASSDISGREKALHMFPQTKSATQPGTKTHPAGGHQGVTFWEKFFASDSKGPFKTKDVVLCDTDSSQIGKKDEIGAAAGKPIHPSVNFRIEQNVVIALDGSDQSINAITWYIERLHRAGNKVILAHVIELPEPRLNEAKNLHMSPGVLATMWKEEEGRVKELEKKMKMLLNDKGIKGVLRTATGKPGEVICRIAEEENAAMVIVGSRGMNRVRRTLIGSVSDFLVNHAFCPVVVCRAKQRKFSGTERTRHGSADSGRVRHFSGENIKKLFSFGSKSSRSHSVSSEPEGLAGAAAASAAMDRDVFKEEDENV